MDYIFSTNLPVEQQKSGFAYSYGWHCEIGLKFPESVTSCLRYAMNVNRLTLSFLTLVIRNFPVVQNQFLLKNNSSYC